MGEAFFKKVPPQILYKLTSQHKEYLKIKKQEIKQPSVIQDHSPKREKRDASKADCRAESAEKAEDRNYKRYKKEICAKEDRIPNVSERRHNAKPHSALIFLFISGTEPITERRAERDPAYYVRNACEKDHKPYGQYKSRDTERVDQPHGASAYPTSKNSDKKQDNRNKKYVFFIKLSAIVFNKTDSGLSF